MKTLSILACLLAIGCSQPEQKETDTNAGSSEISTQQEDLRIVSANAALTELLCELNVTKSIVATDATSVYPPEIAALPKLGYRNAITAESILGMAPTHVVLCHGDLNEEVVQALSAAGVSVNVFTAPATLVDVPPLADSLASTLAKNVAKTSKEGREQLRQHLDSCANAIQKVTQERSTRPSAVFVYNIGNGTAMCAGQGTSMNKVMNTVGLENAFADIRGYQPVSLESLIAKSPDNVIVFTTLVDEHGGIDGIEEALRVRTWKNKPRIVSHDASYLATFGPRIGSALLWLQAETSESK